MTPQEKAVAKTMRRHQRIGGFRDMLLHCACGWKSPELKARKGSNDFAAARKDQTKSFERHVAKQLIEAADADKHASEATTRAEIAEAAAAEFEDDDRITAWEWLTRHPAFKPCYGETKPLRDSMSERLSGLLAAEKKLAAVRELAVRLIPVTERGEFTVQSTEEAHDEGHTEGWNEALAELAGILEGGS